MCRNCAKRDTCTQPCKWLRKQLKEVTRPASKHEILVDSDRMLQIWTSRSRNSLAMLQHAKPIPPLEMIYSVLTPRQKQVVTLRYQRGMPEREIANRLNISRATVREHLMLSRRKIKSFLAKTRPNGEG